MNLLDSVINQAIQRSIVFNILNITNESNVNSSGGSYFNTPPIGGYTIDENDDYYPLNRYVTYTDDLSSMVFLDVVTRFGSPGSDSLEKNYKEYRRKKLKDLMPYRKIKETDPLLTTQCSICIEEFHTGEFQRTLKCGHPFHKKCIDRWIKKDKNECPMCRTKVI
jgi:hypothetical protein